MKTDERTEGTESADVPSREDVLAMLADVLTQCHYKAAGNGRVSKHASARQGYINAFTSAVAQYRHLSNDIEKIEELEERLDRLEARRGLGSLGEDGDIDALLAAADGDGGGGA